jgi:tryptophan halogenase
VALKRDITLIEGTYVDAKQNDKGDITTLILDDNREIEGEWFVDCTGFAQLLIRKKLGAEYSNYSDHFTHNSVIAWWDEPKYSVTTNATAMKYGWRWNINLQHRSGNGYIYDNNYITADQALEEARSVCGEHIEPVASFTYTPEVAKESWKNNVFAIGLSSGFLEPLEANGIAVICESLYAMQDLWDPTRRDHTLYRDRFNHRVNTVYEDIKDFIALHFRGRRDDTDFWKSHIHDPERIPESLAMKLKDWDHYWQGFVGVEPVVNGYSPAAWMQVIQGLHIFPNTYFSTEFEDKLETGRNVLNTNVKRYKELVAPFWTIDEWIKNIDK